MAQSRPEATHPCTAPKGEAQQALRGQRLAMALGTYLFIFFAVWLIEQMNMGSLSRDQWILFVAIAVVGNAAFYLAIRTGFNLRFADPSLTLWQIVYSAAWGLVPLHALPAVRPIVLMFYLPAFSFGMLRLTRRSYLLAVVCVLSLLGGLQIWEALGPRVQEFRFHYELFLFSLFAILLTWFALFGGFVASLRNRLRQQRAELQAEIAERTRAQVEKDQLIQELQKAAACVKRLSGLLPICASCKKIRDDKGYWNRIEAYLCEHTDVEFSHGCCPECANRLYPGVFKTQGE
jgi:hypothetical protein